LVQTPHVFLNPDPIERNLSTFDKMPSENEMFYSITQRGLDKWNGAFFCGSAALLRRSALNVTGGFSGMTITEDCETAFELHAQGWTSIFVDKPLIAGLQPETFSSFIGQRSRWCQGMLQIMILKNPVFKKGLSFIQRIAYLSSIICWLFPFPRLIFMFAPLAYIFFDIKFFISNIDEAFSYTTCYIIVNLMLQNYLYGRVRWPWISEVYEYVQGVYLFKAIVTVILNPRKPTFNVTAKGLTLDHNHLSELSWPFFAIYGCLLAGSLMAAYRYIYEPGVTELMLVVSIWNFLSLIQAGVALGVVSERKVLDRYPRLTIDRKAMVELKGTYYPASIVDVSAGGCRLIINDKALAENLKINQTRLRINIEPYGEIIRDECLDVIVKHFRCSNDDVHIGVAFHDMSAAEYYVLADLMFGDSDALFRFLKSRRGGKNLFAGTLYFIWLGLSQPVRALYYAFFTKNNNAQHTDSATDPVPEVSGELLRMLMQTASYHLQDDAKISRAKADKAS